MLALRSLPVISSSRSRAAGARDAARIRHSKQVTIDHLYDQGAGPCLQHGGTLQLSDWKWIGACEFWPAWITASHPSIPTARGEKHNRGCPRLGDTATAKLFARPCQNPEAARLGSLRGLAFVQPSDIPHRATLAPLASAEAGVRSSFAGRSEQNTSLLTFPPSGIRHVHGFPSCARYRPPGNPGGAMIPICRSEFEGPYICTSCSGHCGPPGPIHRHSVAYPVTSDPQVDRSPVTGPWSAA